MLPDGRLVKAHVRSRRNVTHVVRTTAWRLTAVGRASGIAQGTPRAAACGPMKAIVHTTEVAAFAAAVAFAVLATPAWGRGGHAGGHSTAHSSGQSSGHSSAHSTPGSIGHSSLSPGGSIGHGAAQTPTLPRTAATAGVKRDEHGRIARDPHAKEAFRKTNPCPATGKTYGACPGYVVDHVQALKRGGADDASNMQWQTHAEAKAKDRWE
jgi:hypothetical protein